MSIADKLQTIANNMQSVYNAGYEKGKAEGGGGEKPTLFAPTIVVNNVSSELTITDNKNGDFIPWYDLYIGGEKITTLTSKTAMLTDYVEHTESVNVYVQSNLTNFNSAESNVVEWVKFEETDGTVGLAYSLASNGTYALCAGIGDAVDTDIKIASTYDGRPVTRISNSAFKSNMNITSVTIPHSVTHIGNSAFQSCINVRSMVIGDSVMSIGSSAFYYCYSLTSIEIPNNVTSIGERAFQSCSGLTNVEIPDGITRINSFTFQSCNRLTGVIIGNNVTSIDEGAFNSCSSLTSIEVPNSVTSIAAYAFYQCGSLKRVDLSTHTSVPSLGDVNAFRLTHVNLQIKVPANLIDEWKAATNWSNYADKIVTEFTNEV